MKRLETVQSHLVTANEYVELQFRPPFAFIRLLNHAYGPAVGNAMTAERRGHLYDSLKKIKAFNTAEGNLKKVCVVLIGSNTPRLFSIGRNPESFLDGVSQSESENGLFLPSLASLNTMVESFPIPVVAVVDGVCSSWGLELALSCHLICATEISRFRFPEVHSGIVPCGGGTINLCRRVGVRKALQMLCSGDKVSVKKATQMGLCDCVIPHGSVEEIFESARQAVTLSIRQRVGRQQPQAAPEVDFAMAAQFSALVQKTRNTTTVGSLFTNRAQLAWQNHVLRETFPRDVTIVYQPLKAVRLAIQYQGNMTTYFEKEKALFIHCVESKEGQCSQHVLWAASGPVREYFKQLSKSIPIPPPHRCFLEDAPHINTIAVIGAGTMGTSVTMMLLYHFPQKRVFLVEMEDSRKSLTLSGLSRFLDFSVAEGRITAAMKKNLLSRLSIIGSPTDPLPALLSQSDLVIECAPEIPQLKKNIFAHLDRICKRSCILATGMTTGKIEDVAVATQRPESVIGLHFYPPANESALVEVSCGPRTAGNVLHTVVELMLGCDKHTILSRNRAGYAGARILQSGLYQAYAMLEDGCLPYQIDRAMKKQFRFKFGIFELEDIIGIDAAASSRQRTGAKEEGAVPEGAPLLFSEGRPTRPVNDIADYLVQKGRLGRKTGEGWYKYRYRRVDPFSTGHSYGRTTKVDNRSRYALLSTREMVPVVSREAELLTMKVSKEKSIMRRDISDQEILERIILAMVNEAAMLLEGGHVTKASDVDSISVFAHGFPAWKGGLLYFVDHVWGIKEVIRRMTIYNLSLSSKAFPTACPTILSLAAENKTFGEKFA